MNNIITYSSAVVAYFHEAKGPSCLYKLLITDPGVLIVHSGRTRVNTIKKNPPDLRLRISQTILT